MFKNAYQGGLLSIFYSCGSKPLELWDVEVKNGHINRLTDNEVRSIVLEIAGSNVSTTYITCPKGGKTLGITLPYMVMIVKSLKKNFTFEVTVNDETGTRRRFRISNFQSKTQILPLCTTMPITLSDGWNQIKFNLAEFTTRSYKTQFIEVVKLRINANIRLRRVYFTEVLLPEDQLPPEYRFYVPLMTTKPKKAGKENVMPSPAKQLTTNADDMKGEDQTPKAKIEVKTQKADFTDKKSKTEGVSVLIPTKGVETIPKESAVTEVDESPEQAKALELITEGEAIAPAEAVITEPKPVPEVEALVPVETVPTGPEPVQAEPVALSGDLAPLATSETAE